MMGRTRCRRSISLKLHEIVFLISLVANAALAGCAYNMSKQPRYNPMEPSGFFPDQRSERPAVQNTVANPDRTGAAGLPVPVTLDLLKRGRERFDIYCSPCHSRTGNGEGMVVQRGFPDPPSYHIERLRQAPDEHFVAVMTEGLGRMWNYANRVDPADRWAVTAYIRALQLSQSAATSDVPQPELIKLLGTKP
jgi:mono/diheme cytochrome c family protein